MRKVYAIGESLIDVITKDGTDIEKKVGGSMLNASVSLSRLNIPISLITEFGKGNFGQMIESFLESNGVDQTYIYKFEDGKTALAKAVLDEKNNASYTFDKSYPTQRLQVAIPEFTPNNILLFGSIYSIENDIWPTLQTIISTAVEKNSVIFYDPNIRKSNLVEGDRKKILRNIEYADIIRASDEDFENVFCSNDFEEAYSSIPELNSRIFIFSCADKGVFLNTPMWKAFYEVPSIVPVSTIGAGDSFNAGLIYGFIKYKVNKQNILELSEDKWNNIIQIAIQFADNVCMNYDNYISNEFAKSILSGR